MSGFELSSYIEGNRVARVFRRGKESFRVTLLDSYTEFQDEKFFESEEAAELFAEDWVMKV
jgi:hypothetical protein